MGLTKDEVITALKQHAVDFQSFDHEPVMTCDAQASALKDVDGLVTKNLFVRDKKRRQYLVTALPDTKVDLKVLSARLGCGKGGLSWASEELLAESLQVEPGCLTPLALANTQSCKHVLLLIDSRLQTSGKKFFVHPIVNSASVLVDSNGLDKFLRGIGREPVYVDLEADPKIDRDNPPDLKQYADTVEAPPKDDDAASSTVSSATPSASSSQINLLAAAAAAKSSAPAKAKKGSNSNNNSKEAAVKQSDAERHIQLTNVVSRTDELINMVTSALLGKSAAEAAADAYALRRLKADVQMQLTAFKNAAYTAGYVAGKEEIVAYATKRYA